MAERQGFESHLSRKQTHLAIASGIQNRSVQASRSPNGVRMECRSAAAVTVQSRSRFARHNDRAHVHVLFLGGQTGLEISDLTPRCQASHNLTSGKLACTSTTRALYGKLTCRAITRCWLTPENSFPSNLNGVRVGLFPTTVLLRSNFRLSVIHPLTR